MKTKQVIAVIGATGEMGSAIAKTISNQKSSVLLQSTDTDKIRSLIDGIRSNKLLDKYLNKTRCPSGTAS